MNRFLALRSFSKYQRFNQSIHKTRHIFQSRLFDSNTCDSEFRNASTDQGSLHDSLAKIVGEGNLSKSLSTRLEYSKDESHFGPEPPEYVVFPTTTEEVSKVCKLCYQKNIPMTPFGTGTGLEGGVNALKGGVTIALTNMKQIVQVNEEDFDCTVEAGVTWRELNSHLNQTGLFFPVDPGASASLGGMASTNASGTNAVYYGTMKDNILNLEVVLPNGVVCKTSGIQTRSKKSSAGYNITGLFVGSEGTLGLITKVTLRLYPIPETSSICVCNFENAADAIEAVIALLQNNITLSRIEYVDELSIAVANQFSKLNPKLAEKPSLFLEVAGNDTSGLIDLVKEIIVDHKGKDFKFSSKTEEKSALMKARHELYYSCKKTRPGHKTIITDVCVPTSKLPNVILKMRGYIQQNNLNGFSFGHVGDGNFHTVLTYDEKDEEETAKVYNVAHQIAKDAIALDGTCTGEHGVGRGKKELLKLEFDAETLMLMKLIKKAIDPKNLLNPYKVLPD